MAGWVGSHFGQRLEGNALRARSNLRARVRPKLHQCWQRRRCMTMASRCTMRSPCPWWQRLEPAASPADGPWRIGRGALGSAFSVKRWRRQTPRWYLPMKSRSTSTATRATLAMAPTRSGAQSRIGSCSSLAHTEMPSWLVGFCVALSSFIAALGAAAAVAATSRSARRRLDHAPQAELDLQALIREL